jgi:hypothetical protein
MGLIRRKRMFQNSQIGPVAVYRRAIVLALFSIFMTEATETEPLREKFSIAFPVLRLPFKGIIASEGERGYMAVRDGPGWDCHGGRSERFQDQHDGCHGHSLASTEEMDSVR